MSNFTIRPSLEVQFTKAPAIAIAGPSGCGKTESAMRLARGYCGPGVPFAVLDTEEKRALYKKSRYQPWDWVDFQPPFSPERYVEALESVKQYKAVIVDSGSHEYAGPGGLQDIHEETLERMSHGDYKRMEALSGPAWKDAKMRHKSKFMSYLIRYPTLLIVCLRAEPKVKFVKVDGKNQIVDAGYQPICEKMFMYEMLVGCKMAPDQAGVPEHIKQLERELEPIFLPGKQIDESTGERLAVWTNLRAAGKPSGAAAGGSQPDDSEPRSNVPSTGAASQVSATTGTKDQIPATRVAPEPITMEQAADLEKLCEGARIPIEKLLGAAKVTKLLDITADRLPGVHKWIDKKAEERRTSAKRHLGLI